MKTPTPLMPKTITMTSKGQVTIPAEIRQYFDLKEGDRLVCQPTEQGFELSRQPSLREVVEQNWRETKKYTAGKPPITKELIREAWAEHVAKKFGA